MMRLRAAEREQRNFRRNTEAHGGTDRTQSAIDIEYRERWLGVAGSQRLVARRIVCLFQSPEICCGHGERPEVRAGDVIGDKARGAESMIEAFYLDLPAVGVPRQR